MNAETAIVNSEAAILARLFQTEQATWTPEAANSILALDFARRDRDRMNELSAKARAGTLTADERQELENYNHVGHLLALMQSKARRSLQSRKDDS